MSYSVLCSTVYILSCGVDRAWRGIQYRSIKKAVSKAGGSTEEVEGVGLKWMGWGVEEGGMANQY